jgi:hypothetical protein
MPSDRSGTRRPSQKQDKGRSSPEAKSRGGSGAGAFLPFKVVGSGALTFAPLCLRAARGGSGGSGALGAVRQ